MAKKNKTVRILDIIESAGERGLSFTEIQRILWYMDHTELFTRAQRGYWCTNLCGGVWYHMGLLAVYCTKNAAGRYVRNDVDHQGHPWAHPYLSRSAVMQNERYNDAHLRWKAGTLYSN